MTKAKMAICAAVCLPLMSLGAPVAFAATAHNLQTSAHTKNANDTAADAQMKQMHMKKKKKMNAM